MNQLTWSLAGVAGVLLLVQIGLTLRMLQLARIVARYEERLGHVSDALSLLTETSESGFRAVAAEIERLGGAAVQKRTARSTATRMSAAARRGRSAQEIAAAEEVSEGEVRLRLHMAEQARLERAHDRSSRGQTRPEGEHAVCE